MKNRVNWSWLFVLLLFKFLTVSFVVKKAYYKQSLRVHPDRVGPDEKENATEKFQTLGQVYSILSDTDKRKLYDETGSWNKIYQ